MYKIRLTDGTEYNARFCAARDDLLTMAFQSFEGLVTVANVFNGNTESVTYAYDSTEDTFTGYTDIAMIQHSAADEFTVILRRAAQ